MRKASEYSSHIHMPDNPLFIIELFIDFGGGVFKKLEGIFGKLKGIFGKLEGIFGKLEGCIWKVEVGIWKVGIWNVGGSICI